MGGGRKNGQTVTFQLQSHPAVAAEYKSSISKIEDLVSQAWMDTKSQVEFAALLQERIHNMENWASTNKRLYQQHWHLVLGKEIFVQIRFRKGCCLVLANKALGMKVILFRSAIDTRPVLSPTTALPPASVLESTTLKLSVEHTNMSKKKLNECLELISTAYQRSEVVDLEAFCLETKNVLTEAYGHTWHVAASSTNCLNVLPSYDLLDDSWLDVRLGKRGGRVVVFQHSGSACDTRFDLLRFVNKAVLMVSMLALCLYGYVKLFCPPDYEECLQEADEALSSPCTNDRISVAKSCDQWNFIALIGISVCVMAGASTKVIRYAMVGRRTKLA